jgi:hypothetical protein
MWTCKYLRASEPAAQGRCRYYEAICTSYRTVPIIEFFIDVFNEKLCNSLGASGQRQAIMDAGTGMSGNTTPSEEKDEKSHFSPL